MTSTRRTTQRIPTKKVNGGLRGKLDTSRTIDDGPDISSGTSSVGMQGLKYVELPPAKPQTEPASQSWTLEKIGSYLGIAGSIFAVFIFFIHMDSNIDVIKADVNAEKDKIEKLDEKVNKQSSAIENVTSSVQRLEGEIRRTQDYIQNKKK